jgi:hypothetical protein
MVTWGKTLSIKVVTALLLAGLATGAQGYGPGREGGSMGGEHRALTQIRGKVICVGCFLNEAQEEQPHKTDTLYQFMHKQGRVVLQVRTVSDPQEWQAFAWPPQLRVRAPETLFEKLTAAEHVGKELEISGRLRRDRTLEVTSVTIRG